MLSKSLIQFSVDCGAVFPPCYLPNYGGGNEDNGNLPQKIPGKYCPSPCPQPCNRPLPTHAFARTPGHPQASLLWGHCSFLLCPGAQGSVHGTTDWFQIGEGVRQDCILSPCLFNFYAEYIMRNAGLDEAQAGIKIARRNINHLRYADDTTLTAESEEELKSLLMKVKEESEKVGLKFNIQKTKIMTSGHITSWQIETVQTVADFILLGSKITADGDCSHEIKRRLLLGRKVMTKLDSMLKSRVITLPTKVRLVKAMVSPVVMYGCESWTVKKAECQRIDAFELWCWRRLLRVPWTARRSNQSILKEISPKYSLEGLMLKLKLQYFGHLM